MRHNPNLDSFDQRAERLMLIRRVGQPNCLICPPWSGENPPRGRKPRTDRYKSRRKGR
jgi:hypothetical protein